MCDGINAIVFCTIEGSPLAQVTREGFKNTKSAVIANIFYEYMDLGTHAFNNKLDLIILEWDPAKSDGDSEDVTYKTNFVMVKSVENYILWFLWDGTCKKGFMMSRIETLGRSLLKMFDNETINS